MQNHSADSSHSYKLAAMKLVSPTKEHLEKHYEDLSDKPFYKGLVTCTQTDMASEEKLANQ